MSEKRFRYGETDLFEWVEDNGEMISTKECVDRLNEQQATINEYKENWDNLVEKASEIAKRNVVLDERIGQLQRENEQLRQELEENKSIINFCSNGDEDEDLHRLIKENEQLRQTIIEMRQDEQLYAMEIVKLNKEVKDNQFLRLGNDY